MTTTFQILSSQQSLWSSHFVQHYTDETVLLNNLRNIQETKIYTSTVKLGNVPATLSSINKNVWSFTPSPSPDVFMALCFSARKTSSFILPWNITDKWFNTPGFEYQPAQRHIILTEVVYDYPHSLQVNSLMVPLNRLLQLPSTYIQIHHSVLNKLCSQKSVIQ